MQVNYYAKYLKYKQKYLDLKKVTVDVGGGGGGGGASSKPPPYPTAAKPLHWWDDSLIKTRGIPPLQAILRWSGKSVKLKKLLLLKTALPAKKLMLILVIDSDNDYMDVN